MYTTGNGNLKTQSPIPYLLKLCHMVKVLLLIIFRHEYVVHA